MQNLQCLTEDQALWLRRILECRMNGGDLAEGIDIPDDIESVLVKRGFVRRWRDGAIEITLGGIREVTQH